MISLCSIIQATVSIVANSTFFNMIDILLNSYPSGVQIFVSFPYW